MQKTKWQQAIKFFELMRQMKPMARLLQVLRESEYNRTGYVARKSSDIFRLFRIISKPDILGIVLLTVLIGILFMAMFRSGSKLSLLSLKHSPMQTHMDPSKPAKVQLVQNGRVKQVVLAPINGVVQHTNFIGTVDKPTLDGGIVNAADGLEVNVVSVEKAGEGQEAGNLENLPKKEHMQNLYANSEGKKQPYNYDLKSEPEITSEKMGVKNTSQKSLAKNALENSEQKIEQKTILKFDTSFPAFQDTWATSARVKDLLHQAAKDGKLDYVLSKTEEKGLPASVATVPMIESRYQENATSPKGAAGAWQLMPATAKDYGVAKEDRYKFKPATEAALNLLNDLHKQFGSWELAFAAYNAGADRVQGALQKNPHAQSVQELDLPKETKDYVNHLMAINNTMETL